MRAGTLHSTGDAPWDLHLMFEDGTTLYRQPELGENLKGEPVEQCEVRLVHDATAAGPAVGPTADWRVLTADEVSRTITTDDVVDKAR